MCNNNITRILFIIHYDNTENESYKDKFFSRLVIKEKKNTFSRVVCQSRVSRNILLKYTNTKNRKFCVKVRAHTISLFDNVLLPVSWVHEFLINLNSTTDPECRFSWLTKCLSHFLLFYTSKKYLSSWGFILYNCLGFLIGKFHR